MDTLKMGAILTLKFNSTFNTPGTLMTSAAADVINHNGHKIDRFKHIRFCYARMTSAQSWSQCHHWFELTSSLPIFEGLYLVIYKTLALFFPVQLRVLRTIFMQKSKPKYACLPSKIVEVWIDRFCVRYDWWRRLHPTSSVSPVCFNIKVKLF